MHASYLYAAGNINTRTCACAATVQAAAGMSADTAEKTAAEAAPSECSEDAVEVSQSQDQQGADLPPPSPGGVGTYSVTIANTCLHCTVRDVHISCGEFGQAQLVVAPADFRRVAVGVCLVRGGGALGPGESVSFRYSSLFQYHLHVASVSCG